MDETVRAYERQAQSDGFARIAGVDEAGRGPLAGPVVSAAVILAFDFSVPGVTDSKRLTPKKRDLLYMAIYREAVSVGIGIVDPVEIDRINILQASLTAMAIAVSNLKPFPDMLLIDGNRSVDKSLFPGERLSTIKQEAIVGGDRKSVSIAAASIVAKVTRDRLMAGYHIDYPQFGFPVHKGYATRAHLEAIERFGCCPIHRQSFRKGANDPFRQQELF